MRKFDFYEFVGILTPGVLVLFGLSRICPAIWLSPIEQKLGFGEFGLLLILAYCAGHLVQAFGNLIEKPYWNCFGGWPSDWVRTGKRHILAQNQKKQLPARIRDVLRITCPTEIHEFSNSDWKALTRQMYVAVRRVGQAERLDIFNGNYSMFRGIAAGLIVLLIAVSLDGKSHAWPIFMALPALVILALYRMHRFAVYYSIELFVQFVSIQPEQKAATKTHE